MQFSLTLWELGTQNFTSPRDCALFGYFLFFKLNQSFICHGSQFSSLFTIFQELMPPWSQCNKSVCTTKFMTWPNDVTITPSWCHNSGTYMSFQSSNDQTFIHNPQLPHSYYFTTRIVVRKFANKGVFFEEIQDSHFPRKREYFGTHLHEFGEKGVNFDVQCFTMKKGGSFGLKSQCFIAKKGLFWAEKSVFCCKKGGHFKTGEPWWVPLFALSKRAGSQLCTIQSFKATTVTGLLLYFTIYLLPL